MSSKFSQIVLANRKVILDAFKTIEVMNKNRPKDAKVEISHSKSVKFHEIAYSKSTNKQEKVMKELNEFLNSGELKLNKYSNTKHHTAKKSVDTINKNYIKTGNQEKYINDIQKSLNAPHRPLSVSYLVYRDPVKQDDDTVVDAALKAVSKGKRRLRMQEDYEQFGGINHATISCDPAKYNIVKGVFVKRYTNDDIKTHELSQTNPIYNMYLAFLCNDKEERLNLTSAQADAYLKAIKIIEIETVKYDDEIEKEYKGSKDKKVEKFNKGRKNEKAEIMLIDTKYRINPCNHNANYFQEIARQNKTHIKHACFINCIIEKFTPYKKWLLTRRNILITINRLDLEDDETTPLSIDDVMPFFVKHKLGLVCIDSLNNLIVNVNSDNKVGVMHVLITDNHCVLLNRNTMSLGRIVNAEGYENMGGKALNSNYSSFKDDAHISKKSFIFINDLDDLVKIIKDNVDMEAEKTINIIHRNDDLENILWNMVQFGYYPSVRKRNGSYASICFTIENLTLCIYSQQIDSMAHGFKFKHGFMLKYVSNYTILYVKKPSNIIDVDFKTPIDELMNTKICDNACDDMACKKNIVNILTGLLEKKQNKKTTTILCNELKQALFHMYAYDGTMKQVNRLIEKVEEKMNLEQLSDNSDSESECEKEENEALFYTVDIDDAMDLTNGFKYIKELIYSLNDEINILLYKKLIKKGATVYCIKTDAHYIDEKGHDEVKKMGILGTNIGQYKIKQKPLNMPSTKYMKSYNEEIKLCVQGFETIEINDEWNKNEISEHVMRGGVIIKGASGSGKSTGAKNVEMNKLFVTPNNLLAHEIEGEAITLHKLLGMTVGTDTTHAGHDVSNYKMIVFDEIYFYNVYMLAKIKAYMAAHPDIIFTGTGDCNQLAPIEVGCNNITNYKNYIENCMSQVFNKQIVLKICKRYKTDEDVKRVEALKADIFDTDLSLLEIANKHFKKIENGYTNIHTLTNICYYKKTGLALCNDIHYRYYKKQYEVGVKLMCKESNLKDMNKNKLINNNLYVIKSCGEKYIVLTEIGDEFEYKISIASAKANFSYSYCNTGHQVQGLTYDTPITIMNIGCPYISREWLYMAATRNRSLSDVYFYEHTEAELKQMTYASKVQYLSRKIAGYVSQDKLKKREIIADEYIDVEWFMNEIHKNKKCSRCGSVFYFENFNGSLSSNLSANRKDNRLCHSKSNCELLCVSCNRQIR